MVCLVVCACMRVAVCTCANRRTCTVKLGPGSDAYVPAKQKIVHPFKAMVLCVLSHAHAILVVCKTTIGADSATAEALAVQFLFGIF